MNLLQLTFKNQSYALLKLRAPACTYLNFPNPNLFPSPKECNVCGYAQTFPLLKHEFKAYYEAKKAAAAAAFEGAESQQASPNEEE